MKYYKAYMLVKVKEGQEWDFIKKIRKEEFKDAKIEYANPIYGTWDILVEISFDSLDSLDRVVTKLRKIENSGIKDSLTYVGACRDYPWE